MILLIFLVLFQKKIELKNHYDGLVEDYHVDLKKHIPSFVPLERGEMTLFFPNTQGVNIQLHSMQNKRSELIAKIDHESQMDIKGLHIDAGKYGLSFESELDICLHYSVLFDSTMCKQIAATDGNSFYLHIEDDPQADLYNTKGIDLCLWNLNEHDAINLSIASRMVFNDTIQVISKNHKHIYNASQDYQISDKIKGHSLVVIHTTNFPFHRRFMIETKPLDNDIHGLEDSANIITTVSNQTYILPQVGLFRQLELNSAPVDPIITLRGSKKEGIFDNEGKFQFSQGPNEVTVHISYSMIIFIVSLLFLVVLIITLVIIIICNSNKKPAPEKDDDVLLDNNMNESFDRTQNPYPVAPQFFFHPQPYYPQYYPPYRPENGFQ